MSKTSHISTGAERHFMKRRLPTPEQAARVVNKLKFNKATIASSAVAPRFKRPGVSRLWGFRLGLQHGDFAAHLLDLLGLGILHHHLPMDPWISWNQTLNAVSVWGRYSFEVIEFFLTDFDFKICLWFDLNCPLVWDSHVATVPS